MRDKQLSLLDGQDISSMVHDLRGPLRGISLYADMLTEQIEPNPLLERIKERAKFMDEMIAALQVTAKRAANMGQLEDFELGPVVADAWDAAAMDGFQRVGQVAGRVHGEPTILTEVLQAIFENARIHGAPGTVALASKVQGRVVLTVDDEGPGIGQGFADRAGRPLQSSKREEGHFGLGLLGARTSMYAMGGQCTWENQEKGLRVVIELEAAKS